MPDIDTIRIKITGEASGASRSINSQISNLEKLNSTIESINNKWSNMDDKGLSKFYSSLKKIEDIHIDKDLGTALKKITDAANNADSAKFNDIAKGIEQIINECKGLESIDVAKLQALASLAQSGRAATSRASRAASENSKNYPLAIRNNASLSNNSSLLTRAQSGTAQTGELSPGGDKEDKDALKRQQDARKYLENEIKNHNARVKEFADKLKSVASGAIKDFANAVKNLAGKAISGLSRGISLAGSGLKTVTNLLASGAKSALKFGLNMAKSSLQNGVFAKSLKSLTGFGSKITQLGRDIMRIAKYRVIRSVIRGITQAFSEGIKNAYQWAKATGDAFATSMDKIATSSLYLKNSLGALATPLINAVAPAIDFVVDKFVDFLNVVNQTIAILTGASTWTKAIKYPTEWAEAAEDGANNARKAVDKYKNTILGIDEINPLNDVNENNPAGGAGGNKDNLDYSSMFETVEISQDMEDALANWGSTLATKINEGVAKINTALEGLPDKARSAGESFATQLNNLNDGIHWDEIGTLIGNGVNTVVAGLNGFYATFEFYDLGSNLATALNSAIDTINADEVGQLLGNKFNAAWSTALGFADNFEFGDLGTKLGTAVNSYFETADLDLKGEAIAKWINGGFETLKNFSVTVDWTAIGNEIGSSINTFFDNFDAPLAGESVGKFIAGGMEAITEMSLTIDWGTIGTKIAETFNSFMDTNAIGATSESLATFVKGGLESIKTFSLTLDWQYLGKALADSLDTWFTEKGKDGKNKNVLSVAAESLSAFISGGLSAITSFALSVDWGYLGTAIGDSINEFFGAKKKNGDQKNVVGLAGDAFGAFISGGVNALKSLTLSIKWDTIAESIGTSINDFFGDEENQLGVTGSAFGGFLARGIDAITTLGETLKWDNIGSKLAESFNGFIESHAISVTASAIGTWLTGGFKLIEGLNDTIKWDDIADELATSFNNFITDFDWEKNGGITGDFIANAIGTLADTISGIDFESAFKGVGEYIDTAWAKVWPSMKKLAAAIIEALAEAIKGLSETTVGKLVLAIAGLNLVFKAKHFATWASSIVTALGSAIGKSSVGATAGAAISNSVESGASGSGSGLLAGIGAAFSKAATAASSSAYILGPAALIGGSIGAAVLGAVKLDEADWDEAINGEGGLYETFAKNFSTYSANQPAEPVFTLKPYPEIPDYYWDEFTGQVYDQMGNYSFTDEENSWKIKFGLETSEDVELFTKDKIYDPIAKIFGTNKDGKLETSANVKATGSKDTTFDTTYGSNGAGGIFGKVAGAVKNAQAKATGTTDTTFNTTYGDKGTGGIFGKVAGAVKNAEAKATSSVSDGFKTQYGEKGTGGWFKTMVNKVSSVKAEATGSKDSKFDTYYKKDSKGNYVPRLSANSTTATVNGAQNDNAKKYFKLKQDKLLVPNLGSASTTATVNGARNDNAKKYFKLKQDKLLIPNLDDNSATATVKGAQNDNAKKYFKLKQDKLLPNLDNNSATATLKASKATGYQSAIDAYNGLKDKNVTLKLTAELQKVKDKTEKFGDAKAADLLASLKLDKIEQYAEGGFPSSGQLFMARENGIPEYVGSYGNQAAVANNDQIVAGITQGVSAAQAEQNRLLREQNDLLRALYEKEGSSGITSDDVQRALQNTNSRAGHVVGVA